MTEALLTRQDVAERLACSTRQVDRYVASGLLVPFCWIGRLPRFDHPAIERLLEALRSPNA